MKLYYVAHVYTGKIEENYKKAIIRTNKLLDKGLLLFSPIVHSHPLDMYKNRKASFWYKQDLEILKRCDALILCEGWKSSKGCIMEKIFAEALNLEIYEFLDDMNYLKPFRSS